MWKSNCCIFLILSGLMISFAIDILIQQIGTYNLNNNDDSLSNDNMLSNNGIKSKIEAQYGWKALTYTLIYYEESLKTINVTNVTQYNDIYNEYCININIWHYNNTFNFCDNLNELINAGKYYGINVFISMGLIFIGLVVSLLVTMNKINKIQWIYNIYINWRYISLKRVIILVLFIGNILMITCYIKFINTFNDAMMLNMLLLVINPYDNILYNINIDRLYTWKAHTIGYTIIGIIIVFVFSFIVMFIVILYLDKQYGNSLYYQHRKHTLTSGYHVKQTSIKAYNTHNNSINDISYNVSDTHNNSNNIMIPPPSSSVVVPTYTPSTYNNYSGLIPPTSIQNNIPNNINNSLNNNNNNNNNNNSNSYQSI